MFEVMYRDINECPVLINITIPKILRSLMRITFLNLILNKKFYKNENIFD